MADRGTIHGIDDRDSLVWRVHGPTCEIVDIAVYSSRRTGIGRGLVQTLVRSLPDTVRTLYAICRADNHIGRDFYEGCSFRVVGRLQDFYQETGRTGTLDAVMYGLDIGRR